MTVGGAPVPARRSSRSIDFGRELIGAFLRTWRSAPRHDTRRCDPPQRPAGCAAGVAGRAWSSPSSLDAGRAGPIDWRSMSEQKSYRTKPRAKQVARKIIAANKFDVGRRLATYFNRTCPEFVDLIASFGPDDHWMDCGSGETLAV